MKNLTVAIAFLAMLSAPAIAQDLEKGVAAYRAGDYAAALQEFEPLADQGDAEAQLNLGGMYWNGDGVIQDYAKSVKWFQLAAEQGNAFAQGALGRMYAKGQGGLQDQLRAHMWYNIASANGDDKAGDWRDKLAKQMTSATIEKAQAMARECFSSDYKKCGG